MTTTTNNEVQPLAVMGEQREEKKKRLNQYPITKQIGPRSTMRLAYTLFRFEVPDHHDDDDERGTTHLTHFLGYCTNRGIVVQQVSARLWYGKFHRNKTIAKQVQAQVERDGLFYQSGPLEEALQDFPPHWKEKEEEGYMS